MTLHAPTHSFPTRRSSDPLCLVAQSHLESEGADLLVQRVAEGARPRAVRLAAADEDRGLAVAVTRGAAALLATEFLAGAGNVAALARGTRGSAALFEQIGRAHV